jgi:hypothetical protein
MYAGAGAGQYFGTASVVKAFVATELLITGQMHGQVAQTATRMIEYSDDDAYAALAPKVGGLNVITRVARHYHLGRLGTPPPRSKRWCWGNTQVSALGLVRFYARIERDPRVGPWLLNTMHHYQRIAAGGDDQTFGWPAADPDAAVKQGWGGCSSNTNGSEVNSTGTVDHDRFTVAILSNSNAFSKSTWLAKQGAVVSRMAKDIYATLQQLHNPILRLDGMHATGNTVRVSGWTYDSDVPVRQSRIAVTEAERRLASALTTVTRSAINRKYHLSGRHGFLMKLVVRNGWHTLCVRTPNIGEGAHEARTCRTLHVDGTARGGLSSATVIRGIPVLFGWATDPDSGSRSTSVQIRESRTPLGVYPADRYSATVNARHHLVGRHAYRTSLPPGSEGTHTYCAYAINTGPAVSPRYVRLGCRTITLSNNPIGTVENVAGGSGTVTVSGWAYDPNASAASSSVQISIDGAAVTIYADQARPDIDASQHITGQHGYSATLPATPGQHTVTVTLMNTGPGQSVTLSSTTVTVT